MKNRCGQFIVFFICLVFTFGGVIFLCQACPMKSDKPISCCPSSNNTQPTFMSSCCPNQESQSISTPSTGFPKPVSSDIAPALKEIGFPVLEKNILESSSEVFSFHSPPHRFLHSVFLI